MNSKKFFFLLLNKNNILKNKFFFFFNLDKKILFRFDFETLKNFFKKVFFLNYNE
jgi:hypothetical protein